jgi:hypothetical protein
MSNQRKTTLGACNYSIAVLQNLRQDLMDFDNKNKDILWAIGSITITLTTQILQTCCELFNDPSHLDEEVPVRANLIEIRNRFNEFIDRMIQIE